MLLDGMNVWYSELSLVRISTVIAERDFGSSQWRFD